MSKRLNKKTPRNKMIAGHRGDRHRSTAVVRLTTKIPFTDIPCGQVRTLATIEHLSQHAVALYGRKPSAVRPRGLFPTPANESLIPISSKFFTGFSRIFGSSVRQDFARCAHRHISKMLAYDWHKKTEKAVKNLLEIGINRHNSIRISPCIFFRIML